MKKDVLKKANEINEDIENIERVLEDSEKKRWIRVIGAKNTDMMYSVRFQNELAEWLKQKREQYQSELDAM